MKIDAGFAKVARVELTLLDCVRYFHRAAGINGVAQIAKDIGAKANSRALAKAAAAYENSAVRRLGYLPERAGHCRQARALEPFVRQAKTTLSLDPAVKPIAAALAQVHERHAKWKLTINEAVEVAERFGNLIALPLQKIPRENGCSVFVDAELHPYNDQWACLVSIRAIAPQDIEPTILRATGRVHPLDVTFIDEEYLATPWKRSAPSMKTRPTSRPRLQSGQR